MELTIEQLIKIIVGILVVTVVVIGLFLFFKNYVIDFFQNIIPGGKAELILGLVK